MKNINEELNEANTATVERIQSAVNNNGIKIKFIAAQSKITYFRIASVINTDAYRYRTSFTMDEIKRIHKVLNSVKNNI